jgi:hypothetical protein
MARAAGTLRIGPGARSHVSGTCGWLGSHATSAVHAWAETSGARNLRWAAVIYEGPGRKSLAFLLVGGTRAHRGSFPMDGVVDVDIHLGTAGRDRRGDARSAWGTMNVPFEQCESVKRACETALRLARSRIPIYIAGEPGAGRRTLARSVARAVPGASEFAELSANNFDPILLSPPHRRTRVILAEFPELLDPKRQVALAIAADAHAVQLVAWGAGAAADRLDPELRYLVEPGWVLLPPLRDRGRDVVKWAMFFLHRMRGDGALRLSAAAEEALLQGSWPGNLRQLDAALRRAVLRREPADRSSITADELAEPAQEESESVLPLAQAMERFRQSYVLDTLARFDGDRTRTAEALDVDPTILPGLEDARKPSAS